MVLGPKNSTKNLILDKNYNIFGSGSIYFKKDLYVFGGGTVLGNSILQKTGNNKLIRTSIEDISKELGFDATCSPGTVVYGNTCRVCKAGTFSKEFNSLECIKCKPGSYNRSPGSTSEQQCLPCNYGTYTNSSGSKSCEICPKNYDCPLGSISPFKNSTVLVSESYQPQIYKQIDTSKYLLIFRIIASAPLAIILIIFVSFKNLRQRIIKFDLFSEKHSNNENNYMIRKKTLIGTCFSFLFLIATLIFSCTTILSYFLSNIQETKGLVPLAILDSEVSLFTSRKINIEISLYLYGGLCEINSKCIESFEFDIKKISCSKFSKVCESVNNSTCFIYLTCENGEINTGAQIYLTLKERLSYASEIKVKLRVLGC